LNEYLRYALYYVLLTDNDIGPYRSRYVVEVGTLAGYVVVRYLYVFGVPTYQLNPTRVLLVEILGSASAMV
jgi:hypothetical protein